MKKHEAETIINAVRSLVDDKLADRPADRPIAGKAAELPPAPANGRARLSPDDIEELYQSFKRRFIDEAAIDPVLLRLMTTRPEMIVEVEPREVVLDGSTLKGRLARLMAGGYFKETRVTSAVRRELARTGADPGGGGTLSENLAAYVRDGFLVREGDGYAMAAGVKVTERTITTS